MQQRRWAVIEDVRGPISPLFTSILTFWLMLVFLSFGLQIPRKRLAAIVLAIGIVSISTVMFVITDLETHYGGLFVFFPVAVVLKQAFVTEAGGFAPDAFVTGLFDESIWGLGCFGGGVACGVAWNTLVLAILVGAGSTLIGLAFALVATRTRFPAKPLLRLMSILPIITPPFVLSLIHI